MRWERHTTLQRRTHTAVPSRNNLIDTMVKFMVTWSICFHSIILLHRFSPWYAMSHCPTHWLLKRSGVRFHSSGKLWWMAFVVRPTVTCQRRCSCSWCEFTEGVQRDKSCSSTRHRQHHVDLWIFNTCLWRWWNQVICWKYGMVFNNIMEGIKAVQGG